MVALLVIGLLLVGATFAAYVDGRRVVDLWGGVTDAGGTTPYAGDTLQVVFSSTKGAAAACAAVMRSMSACARAHTLWPGKRALRFIGSAERRLMNPECISPATARRWR